MEYIGSGVGLILAVAYYNYRNSLKKTAATTAQSTAPTPKPANTVNNPVKVDAPIKGGGSKLRKNKSH
jgi:hypothetical protein